MQEDLTTDTTGKIRQQPSTETPESSEDWSDSSDTDEPVLGRRGWIRVAWVVAAVIVVVLLATLPPLVNVNRYQRRVAQAISGAIGRPVHFDSITMHLLPLPGFTIQNFVVQEDPAFGVEPAMRSNQVQARVRFASLWRRRIEISHIRLEAPSVNLVRRQDGRWNLQGVVLQASQIEIAPTAQRNPGDKARFPYIEAVDARINIKQGEDKLPWSLVDTRFALWLPDQSEWKLRLEGRPIRTDTDVSDVGSLRIEGTLGRSSSGGPGKKLELHARMDSTPMGEAAKLVLGHDTGWRGSASADLSVQGTTADMHLLTDLHLHNLRRSDFVPRLPMSVDAHCDGSALEGFHQVRGIRCAIPTMQSTSLLDAMNLFDSKEEHVLTAPDILSITADVPDTLDWRSSSAEASLRRGSPEWALGWLRLFSTRLPAEQQVTGYVTMSAKRDPGEASNWQGMAACHCIFPKTAGKPLEKESKGDEAGEDATPKAGKEPVDEDGTNPIAWNIVFSHAPVPGRPDTIAISAGTAPVVTTGKDTPGPEAPLMTDGTITGQLDRYGYTLQYASAEAAREAAALLPPLGDGLTQEMAGALQVQRKWSAAQEWTETPATPVRSARHSNQRRKAR